MIEQNLLYKTECPINDSIKIKIPTIGEILDNQELYYSLVFALTATPIDMMVQLDDLGTDFTTITEFELFVLLFFSEIKTKDASLVFGDLDLSKFELAVNEENNLLVLVDTENDIKIDKEIHRRIAEILRFIHGMKKDERKPGNEEAKKFMIKRARRKLLRANKNNNGSQIESLIVAMVNTEQYKYNYSTTRDLTIYQFNESVGQIIKKVDYDNKMYGVYTGTVNTDKLSQDELNWLIHN